jgi:hypothetical protein
MVRMMADKREAHMLTFLLPSPIMPEIPRLLEGGG